MANPPYVHSPGLANTPGNAAYIAAATPKPAFTAYGPGNPSVEKAGFGDAEAKLGADIAKKKAGGTSTDMNPADFSDDWYKAFFGSYGLPGDVQGSIVDILKKYASDPSTAQALSQQYLRSTPWFQTTFPGFANGVNNGLFTDETGYRNYLNSINGVYNQYLGRHISGDETKAILSEGSSAQTIANRFQGQAFINANQGDIQYLSGNFGEGQMTPDQLTALGNENAGIDTQLGQIQQKVLQKAQQIHDKLFQGSAASPNLSIGANGVFAPSLGGTRNSQQPDVQA